MWDQPLRLDYRLSWHSHTTGLIFIQLFLSGGISLKGTIMLKECQLTFLNATGIFWHCMPFVIWLMSCSLKSRICQLLLAMYWPVIAIAKLKNWNQSQRSRFLLEQMTPQAVINYARTKRRRLSPRKREREKNCFLTKKVLRISSFRTHTCEWVTTPIKREISVNEYLEGKILDIKKILFLMSASGRPSRVGSSGFKQKHARVKFLEMLN